MARTISDEQRALNKKLHQENAGYGNRDDGAGVAGNLGTAIVRIQQLGGCNSLLDYGTGKGKLVRKLREQVGNSITVDGYDPAVEEWDTRPNRMYDIVTCLDVLEHIEVETIDSVLEDIKALTKNFCYLVIDLQPAVKKLADGRNAHILLAPTDWWLSRISRYFTGIASFPVMHASGYQQKLIVAATNRTELMPLMFGFLTKLKVFGFMMDGGPLGKLTEKKKK